MYPSENDQKMPVGRYDCIIVDESHRGYNLDGGMTETDLKFRSQADYVSKYRQTLEYFDAVRIGLTATPAKHTSEIFGQPAYTYSYRQAVMDGFLVDHLPPFRIRTVLNQKGIRFEKGAEVQAYNVATKSIEQATMDDEVQFDVEAFNHRVISEAYTDAVCEALTKEIDPDLDDKTLIFCVDNRHADRVVTALKKAYGDVDDDLIQKITGKADKPLEKIRAFRNDPKPNIVVTVDLLTTGIDVPSIVNLVFLRAVRSRILYEQMIGRATRLCPDIGKEYFRIFDPVGIYTKLKDHTDMKPVVTRPSYPFAKLIGELLAIDDPKHQTQVVEELLGKFQAKRRHLKGAKAKVFETVTGQTPNAFATMLKSKDLAAIREALQTYPKTGELLDKLKPKPKHIYLAEDGDHFIEFERGYGDGNTKPEDYLDGFKTYLEQNKNQLTALLVVTQRPHDLTRWQLCELKLALDDAGYNEAHLRTAWHQAKNEEVAASIIGFIRQRALGSALVPYAHRVDRALAKILQSRKWTTPQRRWLDLIARQMKAETIVDRPALDQGQFKRKGGFDRINTRTFDGQLETILGDLHEAVWQDVG
jgi:type I restriction enzyme R subunit